MKRTGSTERSQHHYTLPFMPSYSQDRSPGRLALSLCLRKLLLEAPGGPHTAALCLLLCRESVVRAGSCSPSATLPTAGRKPPSRDQMPGTSGHVDLQATQVPLLPQLLATWPPHESRLEKGYGRCSDRRRNCW